MKDHLNLWAENLLSQDSLCLPESLNAVGVVDKHLGPRWAFAKVQLSVYPADKFEVDDLVAQKDELGKLGVAWPDSVIFGLLDVLMVAEFGSLHRVRVVLEKAWYHEVDSSEWAFRRAGRDAGLKILERMRKSS